MTTDKSDAIEPREESAWAGPVEPTRPAEPATPAASASKARPKTVAFRSRFLTRPFLVAFAIAGVASLLVGTAAVFAFSGLSGDNIAAGVRVGSVDVSGLSRDQAIEKLTVAYSNLEQGTVSVSTPQGSGTITYQQVGRVPDVEAMADAAMAVGRYGNPLSNVVERLRATAGGENIPVIVKLDPSALATRLREITGTDQINPIDAAVVVVDGVYTVVPSSDGRGIDEVAIAAEILGRLSDYKTPSSIQVDGRFVTLAPQVSNADAQAGIDASQRMIVDVPLVYGTKTFTIKASEIKDKGWIIFGWRSDGTYGPVADPAKVEAWIEDVPSATINIDPVQPKFVFDVEAGQLTAATPGKDGLAVDVESTTIGVASYLDALAKGQNPGENVQIVTAAVKPRLGEEFTADFSNFVVIGSAKVYFYPGEANGYGVNIRRPAEILDRQVVWPGDTFSWWGSLGPVTTKEGFAMGGIIEGGKSDHNGAIGGGICSASTTMFQAAANAGLQIVERHPHTYYINRYSRKDATVYSNGVPGQGYDMRWRNDTKYPILIRGRWTGGNRASSKNWIYFDLLSIDPGRKVTWSTTVTNKVKPTGTTKYVKVAANGMTLKPGQTYIAEYPTEGQDVTLSWTVTDETTGEVIHQKVWPWKYLKVDGLIEIGGPAPTSPPPATPTPAPTDTPAVPPEPTEAPAAAPRRRKLR
jgi:vancomycin resistance protein YoaR